jgi:hypothetical protein
MRNARKALLLGFVIALVGVVASAQVSFSKWRSGTASPRGTPRGR